MKDGDVKKVPGVGMHNSKDLHLVQPKHGSSRFPKSEGGADSEDNAFEYLIELRNPSVDCYMPSLSAQVKWYPILNKHQKLIKCTLNGDEYQEDLGANDLKFKTDKYRSSNSASSPEIKPSPKKIQTNKAQWGSVMIEEVTKLFDIQ